VEGGCPCRPGFPPSVPPLRGEPSPPVGEECCPSGPPPARGHRRSGARPL